MLNVRETYSPGITRNERMNQKLGFNFMYLRAQTTPTRWFALRQETQMHIFTVCGAILSFGHHQGKQKRRIAAAA